MDLRILSGDDPNWHKIFLSGDIIMEKTHIFALTQMLDKMVAKRIEVKPEERIMDAAIKVFCRDGIQGARMQDIADLADISRTMLHYYFRDKGSLSRKAVERIIAKFHKQIHQTIDTDLPFDKKLDLYINDIMDIYSSNRDLVVFGLHESLKNKKLLSKIFMNPLKKQDIFFTQLHEKINGGEIKNFTREEFITFVSSLCAFPFVGEAILKIILSCDDKEWDVFISDYRRRLPDIIKQALYVNYKKQE